MYRVSRSIGKTKGSIRVLAAVVGTMAVVGMVFAGSPALAQGDAQGPRTVEPTLADCQAFVAENGVPETRPLQPNRGYSGWDVCLNMAYDGDLEGYFASADASADGTLQADEQSAYLDTVIGPASDPDQSALTVGKCDALIGEYGMPEARPFVDWGNRGYGDVEVCQAMAYDGDLAGVFATWDANGDGRMDRAEKTAAVESFSSGRAASTGSAGTENEPMTALTLRACDAYIQERGLPGADPLLAYQGGSEVSYNIAVCQSIGMSGDLAGGFTAWDANKDGTLDTDESAAYAESVTGAPVEAPTSPEGTPGEGAAAGQYRDTGSEQTVSEETTGADEGGAATGEQTSSGSTTGPETTGGAAPEQPRDQGVLSAVTETVSGILPDSGGAALAGLLAAAVLIVGGGFLAYRSFR